MKTNTELLMNALCWQGGTVHQVARETGLSALEILELDKHIPDNVIAYAAGERSVRLNVVDICGPAYRACSYRPEKLSFWRGVLAAMQQKVSDSMENEDEWQSIDPGYFWEELAVIEKESK